MRAAEKVFIFVMPSLLPMCNCRIRLPCAISPVLLPVLLLCISCFSNTPLRAQKFYAALGNSIDEITLTPNGCEVKKSKFSCPQAKNNIFSIAVFHDTLYIDAAPKFLYTTFSNPGACVEMDPYLAGGNSLCADDKGVLYSAAGNRVFTYNTRTRSGTIGDTMLYNSTGDLAFYKGRLYMAASPNIIVEVNLDTPLLSRKILSLPTWEIYGLAVSGGTCGTGKLYAFASGDTATTIVEIDVDNARPTGKSWVVAKNYLDAANPTGDENNTPVTITQMDVQPFCYFSTEPSVVKLQAFGANGNPLTYRLSNGMSSTSGVFNNVPVGKYALRIYSAPTCFIDTSLIIGKEYCNSTPVVPTAFTPNHDGLNDALRPLGLQSIKGVFTIYNRLGQKVFETGNFSTGWDGTINNTPQPAGTYIWMLQYKTNDGKTIMQKGTSVLVR